MFRHDLIVLLDALMTVNLLAVLQEDLSCSSWRAAFEATLLCRRAAQWPRSGKQYNHGDVVRHLDEIAGGTKRGR